MWTRFNIAEPAVVKMIEHFRNDWQAVTTELSVLPMTDILKKLDWTQDHYNARFKHWETTV